MVGSTFETLCWILLFPYCIVLLNSRVSVGVYWDSFYVSNYSFCLYIVLLILFSCLCSYSSLHFFFFFFFFLGPHVQHMEVPRLGVQLELQLLTYITAIAMLWDPSWVCDLCHSSWQCQILTHLRGQGSNLYPHGSLLGSLPLSHDGNSITLLPFVGGALCGWAHSFLCVYMDWYYVCMCTQV